MQQDKIKAKIKACQIFYMSHLIRQFIYVPFFDYEKKLDFMLLIFYFIIFIVE